MSAKAKAALIALLVVASAGGGAFASRWFSDPTPTRLPLQPSQAVIEREVEEMREAVEGLDAEARARAVRIAGAALGDDYLSVAEEKEVVDNCLREAEIIKATAPYQSLVSGFTFQPQGGDKVAVPGFLFDAGRAAETLEAEFVKRTGAVKERLLVERLRALLRQHTQSDRWLSDGEKSLVTRLITSPEQGKKAGLNRQVAASTIAEYCRSNGIRQGPPRYQYYEEEEGEY